MSPLVDLRIDTALDSRESEFARAMEAREQRPRSRFDFEGFLAERTPFAGLIESHEWDDRDFSYAADRLGAVDDPDLQVLARHMRGAAQAIQDAETRMEMAMTTEMMEALRWNGIPLREQSRTPIGNQDSLGQHPRQRGWMNYPTNVRPVAEPIDEDRKARGATQPSMSERLRGLAREIQMMASLSADARTRNRLMKRAGEMQRLALRTYSAEMENDLRTSNDPDEVNNALNRITNDAARDEDGDQFASFDDWDRNRGDSDADVQDQADDQRDDTALQLDEDVPHLPPGKRVGEDDLGDASLHADDVPGRRKNAATHLALPKGSAYRRKPAGRYSAFGKESLRESGDLTEFLLGELSLHYAGSHQSL